MYILLILYLIFLLIYAALNGYVISRVNKIRIKKDMTTRGIAIYLIAVVVIVMISFILIGTLNWKTNLFSGGAIGF